MNNPNSRATLVKHRGRETETALLDADNLSVRHNDEGALILELFRYGNDGRALESYKFLFCPEEREAIRRVLKAT